MLVHNDDRSIRGSGPSPRKTRLWPPTGSVLFLLSSSSSSKLACLSICYYLRNRFLIIRVYVGFMCIQQGFGSSRYGVYDNDRSSEKWCLIIGVHDFAGYYV
jgi:hypothetical protein